MQNNPHKTKIIKTINSLGNRYSSWDIFNDFLETASLSIANGLEAKNSEIRQKRETRYLEIINHYKPDEQKLFVEMLADLVNAMQYELVRSESLTDILGELFHEMNLHNKYKGQFFTPQYICDFMGIIALGDARDKIKEKGYITLNEPACGSGAMILGFANAMIRANLNYSFQLFTEAADIDLKCVHMCYLQLSLYFIPAVVIHGNTLTREEWSRWYTPAYVLGNRHEKLKRESDSKHG